MSELKSTLIDLRRLAARQAAAAREMAVRVAAQHDALRSRSAGLRLDSATAPARHGARAERGSAECAACRELGAYAHQLEQLLVEANEALQLMQDAVEIDRECAAASQRLLVGAGEEIARLAEEAEDSARELRAMNQELQQAR